MLLIPFHISFCYLTHDIWCIFLPVILNPQFRKTVQFYWYKQMLFDVFLMQQLLKDSVCVNRRNNNLYLYGFMLLNFARNIRKGLTYNSGVNLKSKTEGKQCVLPSFCWHGPQLRWEPGTSWFKFCNKRKRGRGGSGGLGRDGERENEWMNKNERIIWIK